MQCLCHLLRGCGAARHGAGVCGCGARPRTDALLLHRPNRFPDRRTRPPPPNSPRLTGAVRVCASLSRCATSRAIHGPLPTAYSPRHSRRGFRCFQLQWPDACRHGLLLLCRFSPPLRRGRRRRRDLANLRHLVPQTPRRLCQLCCIDHPSRAIRSTPMCRLHPGATPTSWFTSAGAGGRMRVRRASPTPRGRLNLQRPRHYQPPSPRRVATLATK